MNLKKGFFRLFLILGIVWFISFLILILPYIHPATYPVAGIVIVVVIYYLGKWILKGFLDK